MPHNQQGLIKRQTLTEAEQTEIELLTAICDNYEGLHIPIDIDLLQSRSSQRTNDFLYYANGALVGYLTVYDWSVEEWELTGMVHPQHRRKGIFRTLLDAAKEESIHSGVRRLLLICEETSISGKAFVQAVGAVYEFSEHEMVLTNFQDRGTFDERLFFQKANASDVDTIAAVLAGSFGVSEDGAKERVMQHLQNPNRHFYLATFGIEGLGCREPVGVLRLEEGAKTVGIYGFGILPDYRGRGYGRQMLEEAIRTIRVSSQKPITLSVDTTNTNALGLYRSCGFETKTTYGYYAIKN
jgi:ribosomal protein S18 acetylase RimI-like enzyme